MRATTFRWVGLALLGIVIAAAVAVAASSLVSRQIGLSSESISAGDTLAPAFAKPKGSGKPYRTPKPAPSAPTTTTTTAPPEPTVTTPAETPEPPVTPSQEGGDGSGDGGSRHGADD